MAWFRSAHTPRQAQAAKAFDDALQSVESALHVFEDLRHTLREIREEAVRAAVSEPPPRALPCEDPPDVRRPEDRIADARRRLALPAKDGGELRADVDAAGRKAPA